MSRDVKIGIFVAGALFILAIFIFVVGDITLIFRKPGYPLYTYFNSTAGLEKSAVVRIAGVKAGYVKDIRLVENKAQVVLDINSEMKVPRGSRATLSALGLLGEKYIEILPGEEKAYCQPGDTIEGLPAFGFDQVGSVLVSIGDQVKEVGEDIRGMIGGEEARVKFRDTLNNLSSLTRDLQEVLASNRDDIRSGVKASSQAFQKFEQRVDEASQNLDELISLLKETVEENRENVKINLKSLKDVIQKTEESLRLLNESLDKINKGEGTVGKLINEPELYEKAQETVDEIQGVIQPLSRMRFTLSLRGDYLGDSELLRSTFSLRFWPTADKFILAQIIRDPWLDKFTYSAQGGIRWRGFLPRAGIMESKFGAGLDYYLLQDRLRFSVEGFDFNRDPRPRLRFWTQYSFSKYFYILIGIDDFTLSHQREAFFGFGLGIQ